MTAAPPQQVLKLETLQLQDLVNLKKRVEGDFQTFLNSFNGFKYLGQKFDDTRILVKNIKEQCKPDDEILVPLTNSLFVPGSMASNDNFLLELGTGYYVERSADQTVDYCQRKVDLLKFNCEKLQKDIEDKRQFLEQIQIQIQRKAEAQQKMAQAQQAK